MSGSQERDNEQTRRPGCRDRGGAQFVDFEYDDPIVGVHHSKIGGDREGERAISLADGQKIRYLNINHKLADRNGVLYEGMMNADKLHSAIRGYQVWPDGLKPIRTGLLEPPASEDHAPPPTGDPSKNRPATVR